MAKTPKHENWSESVWPKSVWPKSAMTDATPVLHRLMNVTDDAATGSDHPEGTGDCRGPPESGRRLG